VKVRGGQGLFLAPEALHSADPGVGVQVGQGEELVAGFFDAVLHSQPVERGALGVVLAGGEFDWARDETESIQSAGISSAGALHLLGRHKVLNAVYPDMESLGFRTVRSLIGLKFARMYSQSKQDSKAGAAAPKAPGESGKSGQ
jgi:hypothetical protein